MTDNSTYRTFASSVAEEEKMQRRQRSERKKNAQRGGGGVPPAVGAGASVCRVKDTRTEFKVPDEPLTWIEINGMRFEPKHGCNYWTDYFALVQKIRRGEWKEADAYRSLMLDDLWALIFFGLRTPIANHPWWVNACFDVQTGPKTDTVDEWARDHGKSTIITIGETIQDILRNPEERICLYSYTKSTAQVFLKPIKEHLAENKFLISLFPDILWEDIRQAPQWNDDGITVKRPSPMKECTVEPWGLTEGQPTARHFTKRVYDDIEVVEIADSPKITQQVKDRFDLSENTGCEGGRRRVIGTPYHPEGVLQYIKGQKKVDGTPMWIHRKKPATHDGTANGKPVWLSQGELDKRKVNPRLFNSQMLLKADSDGVNKLPYDLIHIISREHLPARMLKFMLVDPSGSSGERRDGRAPDSWSIWVVGVDPFINELGASKRYILDGFLGAASLEEALPIITAMYIRNSWINCLGVEKVGQSTAEVHIANALRAKRRVVSTEFGTLRILSPAGRSKADRIDSGFGMPLRSGLYYMLDTVPQETKAALREQLQRYPMWHDDGPDSLGYLNDMIGGQFLQKEPEKEEEQERRPDIFERARLRRRAERAVQRRRWTRA